MDLRDTNKYPKTDKPIKLFLPNLNPIDADFIGRMLDELVKHVRSRFHLSDDANFQFTQNNHRDMVALIQAMLPYTEDKNGDVTSVSDFSLPNISNISFDHDAFNRENIQENVALLKKTIDVVSNKLFVNWINILPMTLDTYQSSRAWQSAQDIIPKLSPYSLFHGIHFYDIFNTLNKFLYRDIVRLKWLLYEIPVAPGTRPLMYYNLLDEYFPISSLELYPQLEDVPARVNITKMWNKLLQESVMASDEGKRKYHFLRSIVVNYCKENNIKLPSEIQDDEDSDEEVIGDDMNQLMPFIKTLNFPSIYNYLHNAINTFHLTWYGKSIKNLNTDLGHMVLNGRKYFFSYKNFYNYAKHICIRYKDVDAAWKLKDEDVEEIIRKLKNGSGFKIHNVIKTIYGNVFDRNTLNRGIEEFVLSKLVQVTFETHIYNGLYSVFVPNKHLTDYNFIGDDFDTRSAGIKKALHKTVFRYENAFYYLTGTKYKDLVLYDDKTGKQISYFEYMLNGSSWYAYYSMDWLFQVQFFHHFLNNRVMFVTGATGQGKSTQVPKLLHYGLRAFEMQMRPKVVSSQPRVKPTKDNAVFISKEMGVPNKQYSKVLGVEVNAFNTYVQYQSQNDKSFINNRGPYIREVTDGLLLEQLINKPDTDAHVIIIDEAHEHNKNMDLLLTVMRDILYTTKDLRLVITSATMEEDEKIYRRYYRYIEDATKHVDRRVHLAPPFEKSRYVVQDVYLPSEPQNYEEAEKLGVQKVIDITNRNKKGDILFFSIGKNAIQNICNELNEKLPPHAIALPFFRELDTEWQDVFTNISTNWDKINFDRSRLFDVIDGNDVPRGRRSAYSQAVIVCTNIAEASITIDSLACVVDTGYFNHVFFDPEKRATQMEVIPISDMSRTQRRGRVGRKSDGVAYYMYTAGSRKLSKKRYAICDDDFTMSMYKLLTTIDDKTKTLPSIGGTRFVDGRYDMETVLDKNASFYIIHPCEDTIDRNDDGTLKEGTDKIIKKMDIFKEMGKSYELFDDSYRLDTSLNTLLMSEVKNFQNENVTELYVLSVVRTLYYAHSFRCLNEVTCIMVMLRSKNYYKFLRLHPKTQSEIIQLYNLTKRFYKLLEKKPQQSSISVNSKSKYDAWKQEFLLKGSYVNMWNKIDMDKEEFIRLHHRDGTEQPEDDTEQPVYTYDPTNLVKYLSSKSKVQSIEAFAKSFANNITYFPLKIKKLKTQLVEYKDVRRTDSVEENIHRAFMMGFPLNVVEIRGNTATNNDISYSFTKANHNIMAPNGKFLYLSLDIEGEPQILSQIIS